MYFCSPLGRKVSLVGEISGSHGGEYEDDCAVSTSEKSVNLYQTTLRGIPEYGLIIVVS
jgi:hypothetical protein